MAEAQDAGEAPHQPEREREQRPDQQQRRRVRFAHRRPQQQNQRGGDQPAPADAADAERWAARHAEFLKKRPVMPCGIRRSRMIASASIAISPITGVEPNETIWLMVPKMT